jgi:hypothetical protein
VKKDRLPFSAFRDPNISAESIAGKLASVMRRFSSLTFHQSLQSSVDLRAQPMLNTSLWLGAPRGRHLCAPTPRFRPRPSLSHTEHQIFPLDTASDSYQNIILKFRDHPLMTRKSGFCSWPPIWTTTHHNQNDKPTGEIGTLQQV